MLGRFLELSLLTPDIRASLDFYVKLGFSQAEVGETWAHPYAVVTDGRIWLGLHQQLESAPVMTFVKPNLLRHIEALEALGVEFQYRRLGNDVFNEVAWCDPSGHLIRCIEARTFSPAKRAANDASVCGYFVELALPAPDRARAKTYWESFGFVGMDEEAAPLPHVACTSDTFDLGLYDPLHVRQPTLLFDVANLDGALALLGARGIDPRGAVPAPLKHRPAALMIAPEGTPILLATGAAD